MKRLIPNQNTIIIPAKRFNFKEKSKELKFCVDFVFIRDSFPNFQFAIDFRRSP